VRDHLDETSVRMARNGIRAKARMGSRLRQDVSAAVSESFTKPS